VRLRALAAVLAFETTVADSADNRKVALQRKSRNELVRAALMKLSPEHREIIDLNYYHEKIEYAVTCADS
jgi:hypothetical protein